MRDTLLRWRREAGLNKESAEPSKPAVSVGWTDRYSLRAGAAPLQRPCLLRLAHALPDGAEPGVVYRHRP